MGKAPHPLDRWHGVDAAEAEALRAASNVDLTAETKPSAAADEELLLVEEAPALAPLPAASIPALPARRAGDIAIGALFGLLAAGWIALWIGGAAPSRIDLATLANTIALASGPLALLGIVYLLLQRSPRREAVRFGETALSMRAEGERLEATVAQVSATLERQRAELAAHGAALLDAGERAADKLRQISTDMRDETDLLDRHTRQLHDAAGLARADIGGLMTELPRSLEITNEVAGSIRSIGGSAREHAETLSATLAAIIARSQEADELVGAATGRLAAQIGRIETRTERTARTIDEAGDALGRSVEETLDRASAAIEQTRSGMDLQRQAMAAMIDHGRAALDEAGTAAAASIAGRLSEMGAHAEALAAQLARQDEDARRLVAHLGQALDAIEQRFEALGATGAEQTADLAELIVTLSEHVENLGQAVTGGLAGARTLTERANGLRIALDSILATVEQDLPQTMQRVETEAGRGGTAMRVITEQADQLVVAVERAADRLGSTDLMIARQRDMVAGLGDEAARRLAAVAAEGDSMIERQRALSEVFAEEAQARLEALRDHSGELGRLIGESESQLRSLAELSGSRLVDAMIKVRETAADAARSAREALESIVPEAGEQLARSGAEAIERALGDSVTQRIHLISDTAEAAVTAANIASEKLLAQLLSIAEASATMEKRVAEAKARHEESAQAEMSREVALLVDHLNSAAIDVARLLSHDVPDGAWRAYLHGDHGAFTRTAVRLLRREEAGRVAQLYDAQPEFREHVNRYIHDFEALLRRILESRDGGALAITMLSSDMGKLYVALAQAIERLLV